MCLAIPARITQLKEGRLARVDIMGVSRDVALDLTPFARVDDFVLVHAGFAIEVVDPVYAQETLDLIAQFPELIEDEAPFEEAPRSLASLLAEEVPPLPASLREDADASSAQIKGGQAALSGN